MTVRTSLVALLLAASACSGSSDDQSAEPPTPARTSESATTSTPSPTGKPPSVAPVDLPPCQTIDYDLSPNGAGAGSPLAAIKAWGASEAAQVPPVPSAGWERLPADNESTKVTMTNSTAPVWIVEVTRTSGGGWVVTRASWGVCH
ncbi:hypothetical protein GEV29_10595 [Aeromicrobium sp. SMF47]|uniref:hypothetical protein n=1 Tax=Aeromicrobium TaxID=2040 RepID=UPI00129DE7B0|nr:MULTISPECIES: hypothetical protein [Aeromicrobium]MRJ76988.1 hypothetical protein [Aeromicrobium yanjiei]MRK01332.1 hypothetical protein [Aeromicrobium sp. S22]